MTDHPEDGPLSAAIRAGADGDAILRRLMAKMRGGQPSTHNHRKRTPYAEWSIARREAPPKPERGDDG